jgi:hypothetical protein
MVVALLRASAFAASLSGGEVPQRSHHIALPAASQSRRQIRMFRSASSHRHCIWPSRKAAANRSDVPSTASRSAFSASAL